MPRSGFLRAGCLTHGRVYMPVLLSQLVGLLFHFLDNTFRSTAAAAAKSLQSCLTLCDPIDGSPPGYPGPGILQARTLEWVAMSFSNTGK